MTYPHPLTITAAAAVAQCIFQEGDISVCVVEHDCGIPLLYGLEVIMRDQKDLFVPTLLADETSDQGSAWVTDNGAEARAWAYYLMARIKHASSVASLDGFAT